MRYVCDAIREFFSPSATRSWTMVPKINLVVRSILSFQTIFQRIKISLISPTIILPRRAVEVALPMLMGDGCWNGSAMAGSIDLVTPPNVSAKAPRLSNRCPNGDNNVGNENPGNVNGNAGNKLKIAFRRRRLPWPKI